MGVSMEQNEIRSPKAS